MATAKTIKPIESAFCTVRLCARVTTGPGPHAGLAMARNVVCSAGARWRAVSRHHLFAVPDVGAVGRARVLAGRPELGAAA